MFWWKCMRGCDANRQKTKGSIVNRDYEKYEKYQAQIKECEKYIKSYELPK